MHCTPLHDWHVAHGGRMVDFAGWEMPIQYTSIVEEHQAVRQRAGLFDVAHMGRIRFSGPDACRFLDHLLTNDIPKLKAGQIRYSLICNEAGGVLDDVLVYRFADCYRLVVNASNREKIRAWIDAHRGSFDVAVHDETFETFMLAVQGPEAVALVVELASGNPADLRYYTVAEMTVSGTPAIVSRTGYTGEDGFEIVVPADAGIPLWEKLAASALPCGLGCRDTLRLEAGMPLYGHEMNEDVDPLTAGLAFGVKLEAGTFLGRDALLAIQGRPRTRTRVGLVLDGRRIAREGSAVFFGGTTVSGDQNVGRVTSGTFSPTLQASIAMAYVPTTSADPGTPLEVDIRGKRESARVVELPFYRRG